ncbi:SMI1/KNR4 family protein [Streptomyces sp. enrichment culture]|uniref:SMI1/KNR4 family protein n=1 Tax=Streptomyces sp. enrichment culture TaxID=1795815 RepID=UPI003F569A6A
MNVEIDPLARSAAARLGGGAPYALKAVAGWLTDNPDMGEPSERPGVLTVSIDGDMIEDCPALAIGYVREPDRIEIRYINAVPSPESDVTAQGEESAQEKVRATDPATEAVVVREIADAWHRITSWLRRNAPASRAALRAGASPDALAALEAELGVFIPAELRTLWLLAEGDDGANGWGCMPGNWALMTLDAVAAVYRLRMDLQAGQNISNTADERTIVWKPTWIPVVALGPADRTTGLYLDTETGLLDRWSRYSEDAGEERDTLVTYLEEAADMLESPALAVRDKPGLIDGTLVWLSSIDPEREDRWQPLTG